MLPLLLVPRIRFDFGAASVFNRAAAYRPSIAEYRDLMADLVGARPRRSLIAGFPILALWLVFRM
jgi:hypothetical protein